MATPRTGATTLRMKAFKDRNEALACTKTRNGGFRFRNATLWRRAEMLGVNDDVQAIFNAHRRTRRAS